MCRGMREDAQVSKERRHHHWRTWSRSCCGETWRWAVMWYKDAEGVRGVWRSASAVDVKHQSLNQLRSICHVKPAVRSGSRFLDGGC